MKLTQEVHQLLIHERPAGLVSGLEDVLLFLQIREEFSYVSVFNFGFVFLVKKLHFLDVIFSITNIVGKSTNLRPVSDDAID